MIGPLGELVSGLTSDRAGVPTDGPDDRLRLRRGCWLISSEPQGMGLIGSIVLVCGPDRPHVKAVLLGDVRSRPILQGCLHELGQESQAGIHLYVLARCILRQDLELHVRRQAARRKQLFQNLATLIVRAVFDEKQSPCESRHLYQGSISIIQDLHTAADMWLSDR